MVSETFTNITHAETLQPYQDKTTNTNMLLKEAIGSADLKISKSALLSLNHHNFSNTKLIYTE